MLFRASQSAHFKRGGQRRPHSGDTLLSEQRPEGDEGEAIQLPGARASQAEGTAGEKAWGKGRPGVLQDGRGARSAEQSGAKWGRGWGLGGEA